MIFYRFYFTLIHAIFIIIIPENLVVQKLI